MIRRDRHLHTVHRLLSGHRIVALLGARQVGKTTLARQIRRGFEGKTVWFDLEDPSDLALLEEPKLSLGSLRGLVIIDEVQRRPDLFPILRVLADRPRSGQRFLLLGSASPDLLRQSSESLAGRIAYHNLSGFSIDEIGKRPTQRLWIRGGLPRSFLAPSDRESVVRRRNLIRTFLERDLPQLGITIASTILRRFWTMLAHYHGQIWNASEFARSFGVSDMTVRRYLDLLTSVFVVRQLQPWRANVGKRQVKSPKVYLSDSGLLHSLLGLGTPRAVLSHPKSGASWEGFAMENVLALLEAEPEECFFWATHAGAEIDLLVVRDNRIRGFEFKRTDAPTVTPSMRSALADLKPDRIDVIHAGERSFPLHPKIHAVSMNHLVDDLPRS